MSLNSEKRAPEAPEAKLPRQSPTLTVVSVASAGSTPSRSSNFHISPSMAGQLATLAMALCWTAGIGIIWLTLQGGWTPVLVTGLGASILIVLNQRARGQHQFERAPSLETVLESAVVAACVGGGLSAWLAKTGGAPLPWWTGALILTAVVAASWGGFLLVRWGLLRTNLVVKNVAVVGFSAGERDRIVDELEATPGLHIVVADSSDIDQVVALAANGDLDEVILVSRENPSRFQSIIEAMELFPVDVSMVQEIVAANFAGRQWSNGRVRRGAIILQRHRQGGWAGLAKRIFDIVGAIVALVVLSPVLIALALLIRAETPGPAIFKQVRFGYGGRPFLMWKFRSMRNDMADATGSRLTDRNDPRVTRLGAFIRGTSLDELPQLVNILAGSMSFVGPRPHPAGAKANGILYDVLIPNFKARYRARPGLTGLAQCSGLRGNTDTEDKLLLRFEKDMEYVDRWSLSLDLHVLAKTVIHMAQPDNAF